MNRIAGNRLNKLMLKANKKQAEANELKKKAVDEFYKEFPAEEIDTMLDVVEKFGQTWQQEQARNYHEKVRNCGKLEYEEMNACMVLFDANYDNFLKSENDVDERE